MIVQDLETGHQTNTRVFSFTEKTLEAHEKTLTRLGYLQAKQDDKAILTALLDGYRKAGKMMEAKAIQYALGKLR